MYITEKTLLRFVIPLRQNGESPGVNISLVLALHFAEDAYGYKKDDCIAHNVALLKISKNLPKKILSKISSTYN